MVLYEHLQHCGNSTVEQYKKACPQPLSKKFFREAAKRLISASSPRLLIGFMTLLGLICLLWNINQDVILYDEMEAFKSHPFQAESSCQSVLDGEPFSSNTLRQALIYLNNDTSQLEQDIIETLESARLEFVIHYGPIIEQPYLNVNSKKGRYAVIIFEDLYTYLNMNKDFRPWFDKYLVQFNVGLIFFHSSPDEDIEEISFQEMAGLPLKFVSGLAVKDYHINSFSPLLHIMRPAGMIEGILPSPKRWTVFEAYNDTVFQPVSYAYISEKTLEGNFNLTEAFSRIKKNLFNYVGSLFYGQAGSEWFSTPFVTVIQDPGELDGVRRVIFGGDLEFWVHKVLFLDAITHASYCKMHVPLERYVQFDIEDVFMGLPGKRIVVEDVNALVRFQSFMRHIIPNFTFQLGFSGQYAFRGSNEENEGDKLLLNKHTDFSWFPHMWSHEKAHTFDNSSGLCKLMERNRQFAQRFSLNTSTQYAVSPKHSGVFPVHNELFECWQKVWNITTTSTCEYPHYYPLHKRRGFIHRGLRVLPRESLTLNTTTTKTKEYPGGIKQLDRIIEGGQIFQNILFNKVNIFRTHLSNYGHDRLALHTIDRTVKFIKRWTNLRLIQKPPSELADLYFDAYQDEKQPIWSNPCSDVRHKEIWSENKNCHQFPQFIIVGPRKTGTTALQWYLTMHPNLKTSIRSPTSFEEVQFFNNDQKYFNGIDWYMDYFPNPSKDIVFFEKSVTYFDNRNVPKRLSAVLPKIFIVVVLIDPSDRAYSCYQHFKAYNDPTANAYTFDEIIRAPHDVSTPTEIWSIQARCLQRGLYANHIENWLQYFPGEQIIFVDGHLLTHHPVEEMDKLQRALHTRTIINYDELLRFDEQKGFFCERLADDKTKCLGISKGRQYPDMEIKSRQYLDGYYASTNKKLYSQMEGMDREIPLWLMAKMEYW